MTKIKLPEDIISFFGKRGISLTAEAWRSPGEENSAVKQAVLSLDGSRNTFREYIDGTKIIEAGFEVRLRVRADSLKDRLDAGIALYKAGIVPKLLLSGDNGQESHNEIHVMLRYTREAGVPEADIFCDHAGFSTYDSVYRAADIFKAERVIIVTQQYHEYRALYLADKLGLAAVGVASDQRSYFGQRYREAREILARNKDFFKVLLRGKAKYGGEAIPISGSGISSHGE